MPENVAAATADCRSALGSCLLVLNSSTCSPNNAVPSGPSHRMCRQFGATKRRGMYVCISAFLTARTYVRTLCLSPAPSPRVDYRFRPTLAVRQSAKHSPQYYEPDEKKGILAVPDVRPRKWRAVSALRALGKDCCRRSVTFLTAHNMSDVATELPVLYGRTLRGGPHLPAAYRDSPVRQSALPLSRRTFFGEDVWRCCRESICRRCRVFCFVFVCGGTNGVVR